MIKRDRLTPVLVTTLLVVINLSAIYGQAHYFQPYTGDIVTAYGLASSIELIGVYLAHMTHKFLMADQSPGSARAGSYLVGLVAAWLNFEHWHGVLGATFAVFSALSPYLWSVWSRYQHRQRLAELGMTDARGLRLSMARKIMHPRKSFELFRYAAWEGITDVAEARLALEIDSSIGNTGKDVGNTGKDTGNVDADMERKIKIVNQATKIKGEVGSWSAAARQLGISERTLFNYRWEIESDKRGASDAG